MAFFDKLNDFAKNIGDKTTDAIETGKLNSKINAENTAAGEDLKKIGAHYYNLFAAGDANGVVVPEVLEFCESAKAHYEAAAAAQAEIEKIKADNEAAKAAAAAQAAVPVTPAAAPAGPAKRFCVSCGVEMASAVKFCPQCGQKNE